MRLPRPQPAWRRALRAALASAIAALLITGCAFSIDNAPVNRPPQAQTVAPPRDIVGEDVISLSLSGGGMRAAAFGFGVLKGLESLSADGDDLVGDITFMSSVSGGSLLAAYYGLHGRRALGDFRGAVLERNMEFGLRLSIFKPDNFVRFLRGGLNDRRHLTDYLDDQVFKRATFADLYRQRKPDVWINATDLYNRVPFPFIAPVFGGACIDLGSLPVAEAVSASMAVPVVFAPVVLKTFPEQCSEPPAPWVDRTLANPSASKLLSDTARAIRNYRTPERQRYIKLVDGGVTDNFGLSSLLISRAVATTPYGPLTARDGVMVKRMLFIVVDSGRGTGGDWVMTPAGPSGIDIAAAATDTAIDASARLAFENFRNVMQEWQRAMLLWRCSLSDAQVRELRGSLEGWRCDELEFHVGLVSFASLDPGREQGLNAIPTTLSLNRDQLDALMLGGADALFASPALQGYLQSRRLARPAAR